MTTTPAVSTTVSTRAELAALRDRAKGKAEAARQSRLAEQAQCLRAECAAAHEKADTEYAGAVRALYAEQAGALHAEAVPLVRRMLRGDAKVGDAALLGALIRAYRGSFVATWGLDISQNDRGAVVCACLVEAALLADDAELIQVFGHPDAHTYSAGPNVARMATANAFYQVCIGAGATQPEEVLYAFEAMRLAYRTSLAKSPRVPADDEARERWGGDCLKLPAWVGL